MSFVIKIRGGVRVSVRRLCVGFASGVVRCV